MPFRNFKVHVLIALMVVRLATLMVKILRALPAMPILFYLQHHAVFSYGACFLMKEHVLIAQKYIVDVSPAAMKAFLKLCLVTNMRTIYIVTRIMDKNSLEIYAVLPIMINILMAMMAAVVVLVFFQDA